MAKFYITHYVDGDEIVVGTYDTIEAAIAHLRSSDELSLMAVDGSFMIPSRAALEDILREIRQKVN